LSEIETYFEYCDQLGRGKDCFDSVYDLLKHFLNESELMVISKRYGIERREPGASRNYFTLQAIANGRDLTRERVRQIQDQALEKLSSHLVSAFLAPFCEKIGARIESVGGVLACESVYNWSVPIFKRLNPCATTLLLSDVEGCGFLYKHGVFTCWSEQKLDDLHARLIRKLESLKQPLPLGQIHDTLAETEIFAMLRSLDDLLITADGRVIYSVGSLENFIYEVVGDDPQPFHYKKLREWLNDKLDARTQKGHGYYLHKLLAMKSFERKGFGIYDPRRK